MKIARAEIGGQAVYAVAEPKNDRLIPAAGDPFSGLRPAGGNLRLSETRLLAPILPSKIVAVGLNYQDHADEQNAQLPEEPRLFIKPATAVIGPDDAIVYPEMSERVDYEAELAVVISRRTRNVPPEEALRHVLGYTCGNDVTARDLQKKDRQWTRAKSFDTFAPLGPWIETDLDPSSCAVEARLNGEIRQSSSTGKMIFSVPFLVSFISRVMTLLPGDVILTGTPAGIGPMERGDTIEITVGGIGTLRNRVQ